MNMKLRLGVMASVLMASSSVMASGTGSRGTATAQFLKFGAGARAAALGEAYTALASGAEALYWNPAGLASLERWSAGFMHMAGFEESSYEFLGFAMPAASGVVAVGAQYFTTGAIDKLDATGMSQGTFTPSDLGLSLSYAGKLKDYGVGGSVKFVRSTVVGSGEAVAVDLGVQTPALLDGKLTLGLSARNFGTEMKFEEASESLPSSLRLGGAYELAAGLVVAVDLASPSDNRVEAALGAEWALKIGSDWKFAARAGGNTRTLGDIDGFTGASFGAGLSAKGVSVDYAVVPAGDLGTNHRISVSLR